MKYALSFLLGALAIMILDLIWASKGYAQDVKYCKNYQTGEVIVVEANMPCPFPMAEL